MSIKIPTRKISPINAVETPAKHIAVAGMGDSKFKVPVRKVKTQPLIAPVFRLPDKTYTEYFNGCQPVRVEEYNTPDFTAEKVRPAIEPKTSDETKTKKTIMAKAKKTTSTKKPGKIAFIDELLLSGKHTKAQVVEKLNKEFGVVLKTAKNTVNWAASTMKERIGKVSKHLPTVKESKPAKKPAAKKTIVPKRKPSTPAVTSVAV